MKRGVNSDLSNDLTAIVLAGQQDFGRCDLPLPPALWPVAGKSALERIIDELMAEHITKIVVCAHGLTELINAQLCKDVLEKIKLIDEKLPVGTAGCIRDAAAIMPAKYYFVLNANLINMPEVAGVLRLHKTHNSVMTMFLNPGDEKQIAGVYLCDHKVIEQIPKEGFGDIKEGLIAALWRQGSAVQIATLPQPTGTFRTPDEYIQCLSQFLPDIAEDHCSEIKDNIFISPDVRISQSAQIYGPALIMRNSVIEAGAKIIGPVIIEPGCRIGSQVTVNNSVCWAGTQILPSATMSMCVASFNSVVPNRNYLCNAVITETATMFDKMDALFGRALNKFTDAVKSLAGSIKAKMPQPMHALLDATNGGFSATILAIFAAFIWMYKPEVSELIDIWLKSDEYSSGLLVPLLAAYVVWTRKEDLVHTPMQSSIYGLVLFGIAQVIRLVGLLLMYASAQRLSVVLSLAGLTWFVFGTKLFKKLLPILAFLILMLPVPKSVHAMIMAPLQNWATASAVFSLEMMGYEVSREGNVIHVGDTTVAVAEACNGLRMITAFFVISGLVVLIIQRNWWEKAVVLASALPIGFLCNTVRLTCTSMAFTIVKGEFWEKTFHDFGGLAMMPLALAVIVLELWFLRSLTINQDYKAKAA